MNRRGTFARYLQSIRDRLFDAHAPAEFSRFGPAPVAEQGLDSLDGCRASFLIRGAEADAEPLQCLLRGAEQTGRSMPFPLRCEESAELQKAVRADLVVAELPTQLVALLEKGQ